VTDAYRRRRGRRYAIATSLLYREHGSPQWRKGTTVNVSRSGVLFRTDGKVPGMSQRLDFILTLPLNRKSPEPHARCTGHVVRMNPDVFPFGGHAVAVAIDGYLLEGRLPV
jgi:hypothetical protein